MRVTGWDRVTRRAPAQLSQFVDLRISCTYPSPHLLVSRVQVLCLHLSLIELTEAHGITKTYGSEDRLFRHELEEGDGDEPPVNALEAHLNPDDDDIYVNGDGQPVSRTFLGARRWPTSPSNEPTPCQVDVVRTLWRTTTPMMRQFREVQGVPRPWYNYVTLLRTIIGDGDEWNLISVFTHQDLGDCPASELPSTDEMERLGGYLKVSRRK